MKNKTRTLYKKYYNYSKTLTELNNTNKINTFKITNKTLEIKS